MITSLQIVAACLILEAGGEGVTGMRAVHEVIQNRVEWTVGRTTELEIVLRPYQFSALNGITTEEAVKRAKKHPAWQSALAIASEAPNANQITHGANHYHSVHSIPPTWAKSMKKTATIGGHVFYKSK